MRLSKSTRIVTSFSLMFSIIFSLPVVSAENTSSTQRIDFSQSSGLLGSADGTDRSKDWAKYFGSGLAFIDTYAEVGTTVKLHWKVTNNDKTPIKNTTVQFLVNKACSSSNAKFKPFGNIPINSGTCAGDGAVIPVKTDENGEFTVELTNLNVEEEGEIRPKDFQKVSSASLRRYSQVTVIIKNQANESIDIVDIHWIKKSETVVNTTTPKVEELLWRQEFNGKKTSRINETTWNYDLGGSGWGNGELQNYEKNAITFDGAGNLLITAKKLINNKKSFCLYGFCEYSSGRINTKGKLAFKYGKLEARIKMPSSGGTWPAFWTLGTNIGDVGWPKCGEIDIVEGVGNAPKQVITALHGPEYSGGSNIGKTFFNKTPLSSSYNTYGIIWKPGEISWTFNGQIVNTVNKNFLGDKTWVYDSPQYLILNIAIGGTLGGDVPKKFTSSNMYIDWIRYSKVDGYGELIKGSEK